MMKNRLHWLWCISLLWVSSLVSVGQELPLVHVDLSHDDMDRAYELLIPSSYDGETNLPIVVALHGRDQGALNMARSTDLTQLGEELGFFVLYPEAVDGQWNYLRDIPFYENAEGLDIDDTDFIRTILGQLQETYAIDVARTYAIGLSNGGFMVHRLACEATDVFAAFASIAATAYGGLEVVCDGAPPVPFMLVHGTLDTIVPWDGQSFPAPDGRLFYVSLPAPATAAYWAGHNQCDGEITTQDLPSNGLSPDSSVRLLVATECAEGGALQFFAVIGGGHTWPGVRWGSTTSVVGAVNLDFSASRAAWAFFRDFSNPMTQE